MRRNSLGSMVGMCLLIFFGVGCKIIEDSDSQRDRSSTSEGRVDVNALPLNVSAAAKGQVPSGTITRAEKQVINRRLMYSMTVKDGEKTHELIVSPDGQ